MSVLHARRRARSSFRSGACRTTWTGVSSSPGICVAAAAVGVVLYLFAGSGRTNLLIADRLVRDHARCRSTVSRSPTPMTASRANAFVEASATLLMINALASCFGPSIAAHGDRPFRQRRRCSSTRRRSMSRWPCSSSVAAARCARPLIGETREQVRADAATGLARRASNSIRAAMREGCLVAPMNRRRVGQDHGLGERHHHQRGHEHPGHDEEHVVEGEGQRLLRRRSAPARRRASVARERRPPCGRRCARRPARVRRCWHAPSPRRSARR